jgi:hypothetical protein
LEGAGRRGAAIEEVERFGGVPATHNGGAIGAQSSGGLDGRLDSRERAAARVPERQDFNSRLFSRHRVVEVEPNSTEEDAANTRNGSVLDRFSGVRKFLDERESCLEIFRESVGSFRTILQPPLSSRSDLPFGARCNSETEAQPALRPFSSARS